MKELLQTKSNRRRFCVLLIVTVVPVLLVPVLPYLRAFECPFRAALGVLCPGCGMSRAMGALLEGQLRESILYNPLAMALLIAGILLYAEQWLRFFGKKVTLLPKNKWLWLSIAAFYIVYCILRNIPAFAFLSIA